MLTGARMSDDPRKNLDFFVGCSLLPLVVSCEHGTTSGCSIRAPVVQAHSACTTFDFTNLKPARGFQIGVQGFVSDHINYSLNQTTKHKKHFAFCIQP
jgi:hypothetical protein